MRNNAFPKGIITPFIKDFHAIHLTLKTVKLIYISTTYLAQTFDLYLHIYVIWIWVGVGVSNNRVSFPLLNGYFMIIFNFFSEEPIHKYILYVLTWIHEQFWVFKQRRLIKFTIHFCKINLQIKLNRSLLFFVYESLENCEHV